MSTTRRLFGVLMVIFVILAGLGFIAPRPTYAHDTTVRARPRLTYSYDASPNDASAPVSPASATSTSTTRSAIRSVALGGGSLASLASRVAAESEGVLVEGAGSGTRSVNLRPDVSDPKWGLTEAHLERHLFGSGPVSLSEIDAAGNPDRWRNYVQDLAGRPATATLKGGIEDIIGSFPQADGSGSFRFGIRIAPGSDGTWDLVTLLTRQ